MKKQGVIALVIGVVLVLGLSSFAIAKGLKRKKEENTPPPDNQKEDDKKEVKEKEVQTIEEVKKETPKKKAIVIVEPLQTTDESGKVIKVADFKNIKIINEGTRVREKPTTTSNIIKSLSKGVELKVVGVAKGLDKDGKQWYQVNSIVGVPFSGFIRSDIVKEV